MIRLALVLGVACIAGWSLLFVQLENKPLGAHLKEVWQSPVVQNKVMLIKRNTPSIKDKARKTLQDGWDDVKDLGMPAILPGGKKPQKSAGPQQASQSDRASFNALVHRVDKEQSETQKN